MTFQDWSYTKKGFLIGFAIGIIFSIFSLIFLKGFPLSMGVLLLIPMIIFAIILEKTFRCSNLGNPLGYQSSCPSSANFLLKAFLGLFVAVIFGLIGMFIGWLIGKTKSKQ